MKQVRKTGIILSVTVCIFLAAFALFFIVQKNRAPIQIYYFYENVCDSCPVEADFLKLVQDKLEGVSEKASYQLVLVNIFRDEKAFREECEKRNIPLEMRTVPMAVIGDRYITTEKDIEVQLRSAFCEAIQIPDTRTLWYYYRPDCGDCKRTAPFLKEILTDYPDMNVIEVDTTEQEPKAQFKQNLAAWKVPEEQWQVPFIWNGTDYLSGTQEIMDHLDTMLAQAMP